MTLFALGVHVDVCVADAVEANAAESAYTSRVYCILDYTTYFMSFMCSVLYTTYG